MVSLDQKNLKIWQEENLEYKRYEYDLSPDDLVLDIGSYQNEFGNKIKEMYGCKIEAFDALDNRAAWTYDGALQMGGQYYYTSLYDKDTPQNEFKCVDIAPYLQREVGLVKINIEGGEYELLAYIISQGLIKNIRNLQVQFHLVDAVNLDNIYNTIAHQLSLTHKLEWRYPFVWESWTRC